MAKLKDGFYKLTASSVGSDLLVLLAGGGAKPISDFALADGTNATGTWSINISGKSATVNCTEATSDTNRPIVVTNKSNGLYYTTKATLNYSTGNITAPTFTGALKGNADTATTASKLSTVSKKAWGLTYWTSGGIPTDISGDMAGVGNITFNKEKAFNIVSGGTFIPTSNIDDYWWGVHRYDTNVAIAVMPASGIFQARFETHLAFGSGNVGIGNIAPQQKLDVSGKIKADALYLTRSNGDVAFTIAEESGTNGYNITASGGSSFIRFYTNSGGSSAVERMRIHTNGYVGIGTSSPTLPLSVNGQERIIASANASSITLDTCALIIGPNTAGHSGYSTGIGFNSLSYGNYINHIHAWIGLGPYTTTATAECYPLVFATNGSTTTNTAPVERMRITPDGNVGIGDSNPAYKLAVAGSICGTVIYANRGGDTTAGGVSLHSNSDPMTYGIAFRGTGTYGTHGYVTAANDWATYLTMNDSTTRGWIFRRGSTNVASIAGNGNMAIGQNLKFSNEAHISTNRSTDYHYGYTFNLTANEQSIGMYSGPAGEAGGVVISPDGCLIYSSSDCGYGLQVRDKDLGSDLTNAATLTFGIELTGQYAWSRGGFKKNGSDDSYVLLGGGGHKAVSDFAPVSHSHSYVSTGGMVNGAYAVIPTYNGETGWHRIAAIDGGTGYGSWILYLCGNWSWASNTSAILHINTMHTTAKITQVSGIVGFVTDVRLVPISNNNYYVDVYINYSGANTPGTVYCYFLGNGAIATRTTVEKITASVSTAASITLVTGTKTNDNSYAAHFYENSDVMLKTNIKSITDSDNMPLLKEFDWKSDGSHGYGLIAQELEAMGYPELVSGELDGTKTVNYSAALSLIVGKLQVKIKELEKEIEILKNKN